METCRFESQQGGLCLIYWANCSHSRWHDCLAWKQKKIAIDYSCESALPLQQIAWCEMDSVLLFWDEDLMMVGPLGDPVYYFYDEPVILIPECDGVRILSNTSLEFLQRVPDSIESIFKIGSTSPAALLYDALDHFVRRSAKPDENLRLIRSSLSDAVESCIDAASHEFDVTCQRALLRVASYGQAFSSNFQHERVQETCRTLRVLNDVRDPDIGIPLSIQQYKLLAAVVLISRLINAHSHLLALRISEYLGIKRPPTGFCLFVEACIDIDEKAEVLKYIRKLSDLVERGEVKRSSGTWIEANGA